MNLLRLLSLWLVRTLGITLLLVALITLFSGCTNKHYRQLIHNKTTRKSKGGRF